MLHPKKEVYNDIQKLCPIFSMPWHIIAIRGPNFTYQTLEL
jgi:hypothetical protein